MSWPGRRGSVRGRLLRLALLLLLPGLLISSLLTWRIFVSTYQDAQTALLETARGLNQLVDRAFVQAEVLLQTLAATDELQTDKLAAFDRLARATAIMHGAIVLQTSNGQELIDTALPLGAPLPRTAPSPDWAQERVGQAHISPFMRLPSGETVVEVILPLGDTNATGASAHRYDLKLIVPTASIQAIVQHNPLPDGWLASVTDDHGIFVARTRAPDRFIGQRAGAGLIEFLHRGSENVRNSISADGIPVVVAFVRSPMSRYVVAVNVARARIARAGEQSGRLLIGLGTAAILLGLFGALIVGRGITRPIDAMALAARRLGESGGYVPVPSGRTDEWGLTEADAVGNAIDMAARALVERADALRDLNETLAARVKTRTAELARANAALAAQGSRLGAILDHMPIGVVVHHQNGGLQFVNHEARRLLGLASSGPVEPGSMPPLRQGQSVLAPQDHPGVGALRGVVAERQLLTLDRPGSTPLDLEVNASPIHDARNRITLSVMTMQDVTARLEAEEARRRSQRLEAVGQLTGGVAHEFNNLLMAVSGCLDLLGPYIAALPEAAGGGANGRAAMLLANAIRATSRGGRLTNQLLAFARRQNLHVEPVDLNALVAGMKELLESTLGRAIDVAVTLDPDAWPALADPAQLELVLLNLAINARDAMQAGGQLMIRTLNAQTGAPIRPEDPPEGDHAVLEVSDSGHGMPPQVLSRAFEPFFTTKDVGRGSGLGLPHVLGVAQQLGGGVAITSVAGASQPGHGTTVRVFLPRATDRPAQGTGPATRPNLTGLLRGRLLLLVDDDADVREITRVMLEEMGADIVEAEGAAEALLILRTARVDLVLADLTMPHVTGIELAADISRFLPDLPVLLMTGYRIASIDNLVAEAGAAMPARNIRGTLQKPFRSEALAEAVIRALRPPDSISAAQSDLGASSPALSRTTDRAHDDDN